MPELRPISVKDGELAKYRRANAPARCPILGHADFIPVVDHCHKTGRIRGVVSSEGNALLGKIENFHRSRCVNGVYDLPTVLRALADYIEGTQGGPYHPVGLRQLTRRFTAMKKAEQVRILLSFGIPQRDIDECKNGKQRAKLYRKALT